MVIPYDHLNGNRSIKLSGKKEIWRIGEMWKKAQFGKKGQSNIKIARKLMGIRIRGNVKWM